MFLARYFEAGVWQIKAEISYLTYSLHCLLLVCWTISGLRQYESASHENTKTGIVISKRQTAAMADVRQVNECEGFLF